MYIHRDNARNIGGFVYICQMRIYDMNSIRALWSKKKKIIQSWDWIPDLLFLRRMTLRKLFSLPEPHFSLLMNIIISNSQDSSEGFNIDSFFIIQVCPCSFNPCVQGWTMFSTCGWDFVYAEGQLKLYADFWLRVMVGSVPLPRSLHCPRVNCIYFNFKNSTMLLLIVKIAIGYWLHTMCGVPYKALYVCFLHKSPK